MKSVCYIINHRDLDFTRRRNLIFTCNYIKSIGLDVLVIEQDSEKKVETLCKDLNVNYGFLYNPGGFNRSWGFNCYRNFIDCDKVFLADNDIIIKKEFIYETISLLDSFNVVRPFNGNVYHYDEIFTSHIVQINKFIENERFNFVNIFNFSGGVCAFNTDYFYNVIGGFDERFVGWGGEDDEMHLRLQRLNTRTFSMNNYGYHLYHDRKLSSPEGNDHYNNNLNFIYDNKRNFNIEIGKIDKYEGYL